METKQKFEEALEQLTQLRVELLKVSNEATEEKVSEIEMTICEGIYLLNHVDLADVRLSLYIEKLLNEYIKKELPDAEVPFHYEYEIASGFKGYIEWLKRKKQ